MDSISANDLLLSDSNDNILEVDANKIQNFLAFNGTVSEEIDIFNMTSLGTFMLLGHYDTTTNHTEEDHNLQRLSLAYERLHSMPKLLLQELASSVKILDLSHNEFDNLNFLSDFKELTSLICDHNNITSLVVLPHLPKMELLWMNHCKISLLYPWIRQLQNSCPNLKYLSLMGNPIAPSYLNGGNFYEYLQYRLFIISLFPNLIHLDDKIVTDDQRKEAKRLYHRPLLERLVSKTQLPNYLRQVSDIFSNVPDFAVPERNVIV